MVEVGNQMYDISWLPLIHKHGVKYSLFWCEQAFSLVCKVILYNYNYKLFIDIDKRHVLFV